MPLGVVSAVIGVSRQLWELPGGTAARWVGLDGLQRARGSVLEEIELRKPRRGQEGE